MLIFIPILTLSVVSTKYPFGRSHFVSLKSVRYKKKISSACDSSPLVPLAAQLMPLIQAWLKETMGSGDGGTHWFGYEF